MADNITAPAAGVAFATDEIANVHTPKTKLVFGANGTSTDVTPTDRLPVQTQEGLATEAKQDDIITAIEGISPGGGSGGDASAANQDEQTVLLTNILAALGLTLTVDGEISLSSTTLSALETTELGASTLAALEAISATVTGTVALDGPTLAALESINAAISGTVALDAPTLAALETIDLGATSLAALESISVTMTGAATAAKQDDTIAAINALAGSEYEAVPASTADAICGATGAIGDYIVGVLITPTTKSPGAVSIKDGSGGTPIPLFAGGADSITTLHPFFIPLGIRCASAGWRLTTGANLTALPVGNFT